MIFTLALTLAGLTTQHQVSFVSYSRQQVSYVEAGALYLCSGVTAFRFDGNAAVSAGKCEPDHLFTSGFEN